MDGPNLASGDFNSSSTTQSPVAVNNDALKPDTGSMDHDGNINSELAVPNAPVEITPQTIEDNELKLKERIAQCRHVIESLKSELNEEKSKLDKETRQPAPETFTEFHSNYSSPYNPEYPDLAYGSSFSANLESKLSCDENLIEYEKQLRIYQNTLNMAQMEKKNAIRRQMLAKAYKLKLLEVENQCNIELLRVKQSLQCLEPLQAIASKWKTCTDDYDYNSFELMPLYSEFNALSGSSLKDEDAKSATKPEHAKDDSPFNLSL